MRLECAAQGSGGWAVMTWCGRWCLFVVQALPLVGCMFLMCRVPGPANLLSVEASHGEGFHSSELVASLLVGHGVGGVRGRGRGVWGRGIVGGQCAAGSNVLPGGHGAAAGGQGAAGRQGAVGG